MCLGVERCDSDDLPMFVDPPNAAIEARHEDEPRHFGDPRSHHSVPLHNASDLFGGVPRHGEERARAPIMVGQIGIPPPALKPSGIKPIFTPEEPQRLIHLRESKNMAWDQAGLRPGGCGRKRSVPSHTSELPAKKQSKWLPEEDALIIELRGSGMKWDDIAKRLPGRSSIGCRLHYQNYLERRSEWDEERKNKLARLYERYSCLPPLF